MTQVFSSDFVSWLRKGEFNLSLFWLKLCNTKVKNCGRTNMASRCFLISLPSVWKLFKISWHLSIRKFHIKILSSGFSLIKLYLATMGGYFSIATIGWISDMTWNRACILKFIGWQTFSVKDPKLNICSFAGQMVSVAALRFCYCSTKAAIDNT